jgi:hypothetical protein
MKLSVFKRLSYRHEFRCCKRCSRRGRRKTNRTRRLYNRMARTTLKLLLRKESR